MTLTTQMAADVAAIMTTDEFGISVTYNSSAITAIAAGGALMPQDAYGAVERQKILWVRKADVAAPAFRDTVVIGSDTWYVGPEHEFEDDADVWRLPIYLDRRVV